MIRTNVHNTPINHPLQQRRELQEARLRYRLQIQSRQIERVMGSHNLPVHVSGGRVEPRKIRFDVQAHLDGAWDRFRELTSDLQRALGVPNIVVSRQNGRLQVEVARPPEVPVALLDVMTMVPELAQETAVLGLSEDGQPVLLNLNGTGVTHILLSGGEGAGKTSLLRTIAISLAAHNRQSNLQQIVIAPKSAYSDLEPLSYLPHMAARICYELHEAAAILNWLAADMENRLLAEETRPTMVVLVDEIVALMELGGAPIIEPLTLLLQRGAHAGIHLVLSTDRPDSPLLDSHLKANLPVRISGRVKDAAAASAAIPGQHNEAASLLGRGDFLIAYNGMVSYFQGAYIEDYDLHLTLTNLQRSFDRILLAQPFVVRPRLPDIPPQPAAAFSFGN
jgi:S-DNA-T family DNA segregation ATPase FtsK/SpoIIIE